MSGTYVVGDIHGHWAPLNALCARKQPDLVLACGDFGYWPRQSPFNETVIKPGTATIRWCDGNHEDFWSLSMRTTDELSPKVIYQPRGSVFTLPDGRNVLFFGGGQSIDKAFRIEGVSWFREEEPSSKELSILVDLDMQIDIVISHTCPVEFKIEEHPYALKLTEKVNDFTRKVLSYALLKFKPALWYFGHWHLSTAGTYENTNWRALNMAPETVWWVPLV